MYRTKQKKGGVELARVGREHTTGGQWPHHQLRTEQRRSGQRQCVGHATRPQPSFNREGRRRPGVVGCKRQLATDRRDTPTATIAGCAGHSRQNVLEERRAPTVVITRNNGNAPVAARSGAAASCAQSRRLRACVSCSVA